MMYLRRTSWYIRRYLPHSRTTCLYELQDDDVPGRYTYATMNGLDAWPAASCSTGKVSARDFDSCRYAGNISWTSRSR